MKTISDIYQIILSNAIKKSLYKITFKDGNMMTGIPFIVSISMPDHNQEFILKIDNSSIKKFTLDDVVDIEQTGWWLYFHAVITF